MICILFWIFVSHIVLFSRRETYRYTLSYWLDTIIAFYFFFFVNSLLRCRVFSWKWGFFSPWFRMFMFATQLALLMISDFVPSYAFCHLWWVFRTSTLVSCTWHSNQGPCSWTNDHSGQKLHRNGSVHYRLPTMISRLISDWFTARLFADWLWWTIVLLSNKTRDYGHGLSMSITNGCWLRLLILSTTKTTHDIFSQTKHGIKL